MSEAGRQSFTDKASSAIKPDSQKGTLEQATDYVTGKADKVASTMQPDSQKSGSQRVGDTATGNTATGNNDSLINKAKNAVGMGGNTGGSNNA